MSEADDYDLWDERYAEENEVRCKFCRVRGLLWEEARGPHNRKQWALVDEDGNIHDCRKRIGPDDFPVVPT